MAERRTRLCIVTPHQSGGGAEYQIATLCNVLIPTGRWEIHLLARNPDPPPPRDGLQVVKIGKGQGIPRFGYSTDFLSLYRALRTIRPDVIYQRVACGYTGICALFGRTHNIPVVWHVAHDADVTHGGSFYGRNPVRQLLEKRSVEYGLRHVRHVVTQTRAQAALLQANYGRTATAIIPNFQPAPEEQIDKSGQLTVLWIANIKRWKRPEVFVRLAESLNDLPSVQFIMVGAGATESGDRQWAEALLQSARSLPNLRYLGAVSQREVNELLARSHVLVNTSEAEGFSNTFIQAWMREVPVVSLDVDPDEVLGREEVGIRAGSEQRLAQVVRQLVTDPGLRAAYAARARVYAMTTHSLQKAELLGDILAAGNGRI